MVISLLFAFLTISFTLQEGQSVKAKSYAHFPQKRVLQFEQFIGCNASFEQIEQLERSLG